MSSKTFCLSVAAVLVAVSAFSEQERVIRIQNNLRFGLDDNIYLDSAEQDSAEIIDVLNISGKLNFSSRSDAVFSYQPEVRYRFDADPKTVTFHDLYGKLDHAVSQRVFLTVSDRLRYQLRDAQAGQVNRTDSNYLNNDLMGAADITLSSLSKLKVGGGYELRTWDDDNYGMTLGNNYDTYTASLSLFRELRKGTTQGMVGVEQANTEYDGSRGSFDRTALMVGADHTFNPNMTGFARVGASLNSTDTAVGSDDSTTPYVDAGLDFNPTEKTSFNGNVGYSAYRAQNSFYNSQDQLKVGIGVRHDFTAKINVASSLSYIMSSYDGTLVTPFGTAGLDTNDDSLRFSVRGTYQINRNNFLQLGYEFTDRSVDTTLLPEFTHNRVDIGWRLRL